LNMKDKKGSGGIEKRNQTTFQNTLRSSKQMVKYIKVTKNVI